MTANRRTHGAFLLFGDGLIWEGRNMIGRCEINLLGPCAEAFRPFSGATCSYPSMDVP
jgi:hypothetical protein